MKENRDSGVAGSVFCTRTLWCKSRIFSVTRQRHQNFFNFCLLPNQCRGGRYPSAHSFACHQLFHACGGVSPLSLADRQVAAGGHMETNNLSHLRSHLCHQLSQLFFFSAPTGNPRRPRPGGGSPPTVAVRWPPLWARQ